MSFLSQAFEPAVLAEGYFAQIDAAREGAAWDAVFDTGRDIAGPEFADSAMDMLVGRRSGAAMAQPVMGDMGAPNREPVQNISETVIKAAAKVEEARAMQRETVQLRAGGMTAASGSGAKAVGDYAQAKGAAADTALKAVGAVREEMKAAKAEVKNTGSAAPSGGGVGGMVKSAAGTSIVAAAAINVAGYGSFVTANAPSSKGFRSPLDGSGYGAGAGHAVVDVMGGSVQAAPVTGVMNQNMAQGPGFGKFDFGAYEHENAASLEGMKFLLDEEGLQAIEADLSEMKEDAKLGEMAYERWKNTGITVAEAAKGMPVARLDINNVQQAALLSDNPALQEVVFKAPNTSFSPMALG